MDAVSRAMVIWAESKDLLVPDQGDPSTLSARRRHIAAIATEAEQSLSNFEPVPARDDQLYGRDVIDCAAAAEAPVQKDLANLRVIV